MIKINSTTANVERDQYTRMCVEVNLTKPLLSKFRLNGRIWGIQYEGLKMICFKCGRQGHKEDAYPLDNEMTPIVTEKEPQVSPNGDSNVVEQERTYGSWMLKSPRRTNTRPQNLGARNRGGQESGESSHIRSRMDPNRVVQEGESEPIRMPHN